MRKKVGLKSDFSNMSQGFTTQLGHPIKKGDSSSKSEKEIIFVLI